MNDQRELPQAEGVFVCHVPGRVSASMEQAISRAWQAAWQSAGKAPPPLMVLQEGMRLERLDAPLPAADRALDGAAGPPDGWDTLDNVR